MTDRKNLNNALSDLDLQLKRIQNAAEEIYKIKNILTTANSTGQVITAEAAQSAIEQVERQLEALAKLSQVSGFAFELNEEVIANAVIA
jgi:chaperonin cofactor prefoldin